VCLLCLAAHAEPEKPADAAKDLESLQGVWNVTAVESRFTQQGAASNSGQVTPRPLVVVGEECAFSAFVGTLKLDPAKHALDLVVTDGFLKGRTLPCLYELSGDTLRLALANPRTPLTRPTELKCGPGTDLVYTCERDAKATKDQAEARLKELKAAAPRRAAALGRDSAATERTLQTILERLDRIDKRLDELEKNTAPPAKK
jgi:uncharacterized protein (TIGR03067 family)